MGQKKVKIGLLGLGTVGSGVYQVLQDNEKLITQRAGVPIEIKKILVRDTQKTRPVRISPGILTTDPGEIFNDPEIQVVVEVMGGTELALDYILEAFSKDKSVVTANKDLLSMHGKDLFEMAQKKNLDLLFEASVAGGIPIIHVLKQCLAANRVEEVIGILNGTTNYMLTQMTKHGQDFREALRDAQELGYAEADPASDVEGYDAARKTAILASIAFNTRVSFHDVYVEGITKISAEDIDYATNLGYVIKLLGIAKETPEGVEVRTHPVMLSQSHPLASVSDSFNAVFVKGDAVGETMFYGRGAGDMPTASAVVADIMDAARNIVHGVTGMISCTCFEEKELKSMGQVKSKNYIRLKVVDRPGVLAQIAQIFGFHNVSLATVNQEDTSSGFAELVLITHKVMEKNLRNALKELESLEVVEEICNVLRVEGND